jgi:hypothetical protein
MVAYFSLPLSGAVLSVFADVLDLRSGKKEMLGRNAWRYFAGDRVSPECEAQVQRGIAHALVDSGLLPPTLNFSDAALLVPPVMSEVPTAYIVEAMIAAYAKRWDALAGALRRCTAPVAFEKHFAGACLRLAAIDLAVRVTALMWLARAEADRPVADFWTTQRGTGLWLRDLVQTAGLTRDRLATELKVPPNTLDGWLDDEVKPSLENIDAVSRAFAAHGIGE